MFKLLEVSRFSNKILKFGGNLLWTRHVTHSFFCTDTSSFSPPVGEFNAAALTNGDKELEHKLKVLILEVDVLRQEGKMVPDGSFLKDKHWQELLILSSFSARRKYLEFLFKLQKRKENHQKQKELKKLSRERQPEKSEKSENLEEFVCKYDLQHNNLFLRIYDTTINKAYNNRLIQAMKFGQKLVVDCGYDNDMTSRENRNCAKQLTLMFAENRNHKDPYDLHFCNIDPDGVLMQTLNNNIGTLHEPWFPLNLHKSSYLDRFPKEELIYLTPHCREEMTTYDHDAIYIIGGIVDKVNNQPLSLAKAKREGIRMLKFPLDRYLQWGCGSGKSLTINQVAAVLLDIKLTGDWRFALRHVPKRKVVDFVPKQTDFRRNWSPLKKFDHKGKKMIKIKSILND